MQTHYAELGLVKINMDSGQMIPENATIQQNLRFDRAFRIMPDSSNPNTSGYPDIRTYLNLEAASGFAPVQITQTFVITNKP